MVKYIYIYIYTHRDFSGLMVVGSQYERGGDPSDSSFSLLQMPCQTQVFYFDNSETMRFI